MQGTMTPTCLACGRSDHETPLVQLLHRGVLGPTRMQYGEAVANVRYVSRVLTELMSEFYGESE